MSTTLVASTPRSSPSESIVIVYCIPDPRQPTLTVPVPGGPVASTTPSSVRAPPGRWPASTGNARTATLSPGIPARSYETCALVHTCDFGPRSRWSRQNPVPPKSARSSQGVPPASWSRRTIGYRNASGACFAYGDSPVPILNTGDATEVRETSNASTPLPVVNVATLLTPARRPVPATAWTL